MTLRHRVPDVAWLLVIALIVIGAGIGLRDPWPADEPRYALIAREMVASGDWLFPRVAGVLYADKPPLFFWLIAVSYTLTGSLRVAFLLPSLLAGLGTLWLVHDLGRRLWDARTGLHAAAILLVTLQFALQARAGQIDAVLAFWTTLGLYGICRHLFTGPAWGWYVAGFAAAGAGVITKGVGFLPLLAFIPWLIARGWREPMPGGWRWLAGPFAMLAVIACWLVPMLLVVAASNDPAYAAYRDDILLRQTAARYASAWHHLEPFWYYLAEVIPVFWLPIAIALPWLVPAWARDLRRRDARTLVLLGWVVLALLFFSLSPGKRGVYILPALPALALIAAPHARALLERRGLQRAAYAVLALIAALWLLALLYYRVLRPEAGDALVARYEVAPWTLLGLLALAAVAALVAGPRRGMYALCGYFLVLWLIVGVYAWPLVNATRTPASIMADVSARIGPDAQLGLVDWKEQHVLFAGRPVTHFGFRRNRDAEMEDGMAWLLAGENRFLLVSDAVPRSCLDTAAATDMGYRHRQHWLLVEAGDIRASCRARYRNREPAIVVHAGNTASTP